ncbi:MAG: sodium ABC transporter ATP-binding protein [Bacillus thermozeamaize]|mgnify:FL=1|uniref:Sodium ABC transporter ATP-binding protein n=1 Tax=Bacillus thermozeamaize TaxID=230954 RepID=A0A1Y3PIK3_9BACI|nr:MAG: sodium ABC transporter ATP-binding protein [Bacillus thermozeamaize]
MALELRDVTKRFGSHVAVNRLNLKVEEGELFGLLGANGAGKTTTMRMILGLLAPTEGEITWFGRRMGYDLSHQIGYLPEERGLYPKLKVEEQLVYLARLRGMEKRKAQRQLREWLERFHVSHYADKRVEELSKGNQQKIQFITAVLHQPKLLILDEPFSGLDPVNVELLKKAVLDLKKQGTTILFSSHRMEHVEELCRTLCILRNGEAVLQGDLAQIKRSYGKKTVRLRMAAEWPDLAAIQGVERVHRTALGYEVKVRDEAVAQTILQEALKVGEVTGFSLEEPSLHEIFIEKVGAAYDEGGGEGE